MKKLKTLIQLGLEGSNIRGAVESHYDRLFIDQFLAIHTIYVIADKLTRNCKWTKLEGFTSPFVPLHYRYSPSNFAAIPLGADHCRFAKISKYFEASHEEAKGAVIFPVEPILPVEQWAYDATHYGPHSQGKSHIEFLRQHLFARYPQSSNAQLPPLYLYMWENMETELPPEVSPLYFFAFLAGSLFFSENGEKSSFPQSLTFSSDVDDSGKAALVIDTQGKNIFMSHPLAGENKQWTLREARYKEMASGWNKIFDIFDHSNQQMTTNDAACARLSEADAYCFKISEPIYRDLLRITRRDNLKVPLALQWASHNFVYLGT